MLGAWCLVLGACEWQKRGSKVQCGVRRGAAVVPCLGSLHQLDDGRYFLAVMMKEGWWGWSVIQKRAIPSEESYNRIVLSRAGGCE